MLSSPIKKGVEREKKASREVEIFRRVWVGKEKKTALAREFGLSRATVERICNKMALKTRYGLEKSKTPVRGTRGFSAQDKRPEGLSLGALVNDGEPYRVQNSHDGFPVICEPIHAVPSFQDT